MVRALPGARPPPVRHDGGPARAVPAAQAPRVALVGRAQREHRGDRGLAGGHVRPAPAPPGDPRPAHWAQVRRRVREHARAGGGQQHQAQGADGDPHEDQAGHGGHGRAHEAKQQDPEEPEEPEVQPHHEDVQAPVRRDVADAGAHGPLGVPHAARQDQDEAQGPAQGQDQDEQGRQGVDHLQLHRERRVRGGARGVALAVASAVGLYATAVVTSALLASWMRNVLPASLEINWKVHAGQSGQRKPVLWQPSCT